MRKFYLACLLAIWASMAFSQDFPTKGNYELAARFSPEKLKRLIFSTEVDAHWLKKSDRFWYEYETPEGKNWYIVNPATKSKTTLFDREKLAAEITKVVKDPFDGQHLDISNLKFLEDENTIQFKVKSTQDVLKKDWKEIKSKNKNAKDSLQKRTFVFRFNISNQQLIEGRSEKKPSDWFNNISRIHHTFVKNENLFWMDKDNFQSCHEKDVPVKTN